MLCTFLYRFAVIFSSIAEFSSQFDGNIRGGSNPGISSSFVAGKQQTPDWTSTEDPSYRDRTRSPTRRSDPIRILEYSLGELGYIRLIPRTNQALRFEFRNYILTAGTQIRWRKDGKKYTPVPTQEHIVLSTSNGVIFAILAHGGFLHGIYSVVSPNPRVKMNMTSGDINNMTPDEVRDCPVGSRRQIFPQTFIKAFADFDSLQFKWSSDAGINSDFHSLPAKQHSTERTPTREVSLIRARSESPTGRPPSDRVLGYTMEQLGYVRLIPRKNQNQRFEFRRYFFPTEIPIRMRIDHVSHVFGSTREYIVLSTSNNDVFAILDHTGILRGIYRGGRAHARIKINMISNAIEDLTPEEMKNCPVGTNRPMFPNSFIEGFANHSSLRSVWNRNSGSYPDYPSPQAQNSQ